MTGKYLIDRMFEAVGRIQTITTDTNLRAVALGWANLILRDINSRSEHWKFCEVTATFPTVISQMTYDLPADIDGYKILDLRQTATPAKLKLYSQQRLDEEFPNPTADSGNPLRYILFANGIRLHPVPSAIITITERYIKKITDVEDNVTVATEVPDKYSHIVLEGMLKFGYRLFPSYGNPRDAFQGYETGIITMLRDNDASPDADYTSESKLGGVGFGGNIRDPHFDTSGPIGEV